MLCSLRHGNACDVDACCHMMRGILSDSLGNCLCVLGWMCVRVLGGGASPLRPVTIIAPRPAPPQVHSCSITRKYNGGAMLRPKLYSLITAAWEATTTPATDTGTGLVAGRGKGRPVKPLVMRGGLPQEPPVATAKQGSTPGYIGRLAEVAAESAGPGGDGQPLLVASG
jgi:hypothetical protein